MKDNTQAFLIPTRDLAQFQALTEKAREKNAANVNCYLLPQQITELTAQRRLYAFEHDAGLTICLDKGVAWDTYFYVNPEKPLHFFQSDRILSSSFVGIKKLPAKSLSLIHALESNGFHKCACANRMSLRLQNSDAIAPFLLQSDSYRVVQAGKSLQAEIRSLWSAFFDELTNDIPNDAALQAEIEKGNILCAVTASSEIAGVIQSNIENGRSWSRHLVVHPRIRGQKIGQALAVAHLQKGLAQGIKEYSLWVLPKDEIAIRLYRKLGYDYDGRFIAQYCKKP